MHKSFNVEALDNEINTVRKPMTNYPQNLHALAVPRQAKQTNIKLCKHFQLGYKLSKQTRVKFSSLIFLTSLKYLEEQT